MTPSFLSPDDLEAKISAWCDTLGIAEADPVSLSAPALVIVDMQNDFLTADGLLPVWGGPAVLPRIARLVGAFRTAGRPVVFTRHIYENPEVDGGATARWWKVDSNSQLLREGTWHAALAPELNPEPGERVIAKRRYSAFFGTDLELLLRTAGVRSVVIAGVCTNICCEATAHDAFFRDFDVFVPVDANGATDEAAHLATLRNLALSYARPVTCQQVVRSLTRGA